MGTMSLTVTTTCLYPPQNVLNLPRTFHHGTRGFVALTPTKQELVYTDKGHWLSICSGTLVIRRRILPLRLYMQPDMSHFGTDHLPKSSPPSFTILCRVRPCKSSRISKLRGLRWSSGTDSFLLLSIASR